MQVAWNKSRSGSLNFMRAGLQGFASEGLGNDGRIHRLHRDGSEGRLAWKKSLDDPADRSTGSDRRDKDVHLTIGIGPDFFRRGLRMDGGIGGIVKLLRHPSAGGFLKKLVGFGDRPAHPFRAGRENQVGTEQGQERAAFDAHGIRHREDDLVAFRGGDKSQANAGISTGWLDDHSTGFEDSALLGVLDHGHANAVFHAAERIKKLALEGDRGWKASGDAVEFDERRAPDGFDDVVINLAHRFYSEERSFYTIKQGAVKLEILTGRSQTTGNRIDAKQNLRKQTIFFGRLRHASRTPTAQEADLVAVEGFQSLAAQGECLRHPRAARLHRSAENLGHHLAGGIKLSQDERENRGLG